MNIRPTSRSVRAVGAASLVLAGSMAAAACGTQQTAPGPKHVKQEAASCTSQIAQLERAVSGSSSSGGGVVGEMAARLIGTIVVTPGHGTSCTTLKPGQTVHLAVGDKLVFEANDAPSLTGKTSSIDVSTAPGTSGPPPLSTAHVVVTLTAVSAGQVSLVWTDCSGTGC